MRSPWSTWFLAAALAAVSATSALAAPGWLGVSTQSTDADLRSGLDLARDGLLVNRVFEDSPAEKAGLRKGDVILRFNGRAVIEPEDLRDLVRDAGSGRSAQVEVWRGGASRMLQVTLGELPESERGATPAPPAPPAPPVDRSRAPELDRLHSPTPPAPPAEPEPRHVRRKVYVNGRELSDEDIERKLRDLRIELPDLRGLRELEGLGDVRVWTDGAAPMAPRGGRGRLGVRVEEVSPELGEALGVGGGKGVVVMQVYEDTPAQSAGLRAGDVILEVAGHPVGDRDDLVRELAEHDGSVDIVLTRKGARRTVKVELPERRSEMRWRAAPRSYSMRIPEPGRAPRVYRFDTGPEGAWGDAELREELRDLKQELRELKEQLGEMQQAEPSTPPRTAAPATPKKK